MKTQGFLHPIMASRPLRISTSMAAGVIRSMKMMIRGSSIYSASRGMEMGQGDRKISSWKERRYVLIRVFRVS